MPIVQERRRRSLFARYRWIATGGRAAVARSVGISATSGIEGVALDQSLRMGLGMPGQRAYGQTVQIAPVTSAWRLLGKAHSFTLTLGLHQARQSDAERRICTLSARNLQRLGCDAGDVVELTRADPEVPGWLLRIRLRVFPTEVGHARKDTETSEIYLDEEGRERLGIARGTTRYVGSPILVRPCVTSALRKYGLLAGMSALLGVSAFTDLLQRWFPSWPAAGIASVAVGAATLLTIVLATSQVRSRLWTR